MVPWAFQGQNITFVVADTGLPGTMWIKFEVLLEIILKMHTVPHLHQMLTYIYAVAK